MVTLVYCFYTIVCIAVTTYFHKHVCHLHCRLEGHDNMELPLVMSFALISRSLLIQHIFFHIVKFLVIALSWNYVSHRTVDQQRKMITFGDSLEKLSRVSFLKHFFIFSKKDLESDKDFEVTSKCLL